MKTLLKNGRVLTKDGFENRDIAIVQDRVTFSSNPLFDHIIHCNNKFVIPGFVDVHVHLREPGFFYKESIRTGTLAAARGGYTTVCSMPNLDPPPDTPDHLQQQLKIIQTDAVVKVYPYGAITMGQKGKGKLSQMEALKDAVFAFSDDGKGIQSATLMEEAMKKAKELDKILVAHCEDESLLNDGYVHEGSYAKAKKHIGISSESEWKQVERDLKLCRKTGVSYHVCHVSTKETVELIRQAKRKGLDVTCETAPHYLIFCDADLQEDGRFKMNPPLRSAEDRTALIRGLKDGTIDMIATDHAPHSKEEKAKGLAESAFGIVGLETAFPVLYTHFVKAGVISLEKLIFLMSIAPRRRFHIPGGYLDHGQKADLALLDLEAGYKIDSGNFLSKGKSTPFEGKNVFGENTKTIVDGKIVWEKREKEKGERTPDA